jgi:hypothetical protein
MACPHISARCGNHRRLVDYGERVAPAARRVAAFGAPALDHATAVQLETVLLLALVDDHFSDHRLDLAPRLLEELVRRREIGGWSLTERALHQQSLRELALAGATPERDHVEARRLAEDLRLRRVRRGEPNCPFAR